jgi:hypothetical protein
MQRGAFLCGASGPVAPRLIEQQPWDRARHRGIAPLGASHEAMQEVVWLWPNGRQPFAGDDLVAERREARDDSRRPLRRDDAHEVREPALAPAAAQATIAKANELLAKDATAYFRDEELQELMFEALERQEAAPQSGPAPGPRLTDVAGAKRNAIVPDNTLRRRDFRRRNPKLEKRRNLEKRDTTGPEAPAQRVPGEGPGIEPCGASLPLDDVRARDPMRSPRRPKQRSSNTARQAYSASTGLRWPPRGTGVRAPRPRRAASRPLSPR